MTVSSSPLLAQTQQLAAGRTPWTSSKVVGSPEPPLPYTTSPFLEHIPWDRPMYAKHEPGTDWLVVVQQGGEKDRPTKLLRVSENGDSTSVLLQIERRVVYGIEFHPNYKHNGQLFLFSNGPTGESPRHNRISRFSVSREDHRCELESEEVIIQWRSEGHDGGELAFGQDSMLYISSGDGTSDSDTWVSGQDVTNLLGGVLRINVDKPSSELAYSIPPDNPFVDHPQARKELWAFGLRNPWRLWADRQSGQIWVGNNGQDLWESVHLIRRGENYGWSVYEGSRPFYPQRERGPAAIVPPTLEHHHTESRSLTGGVVYRGAKHPALDGAYVYGDYSTGKIWAARHDGQRVVWHRELADTIHQIAGFAISPSEELLVIDHGGGLHRLVMNSSTAPPEPFPRRLSETGLFASTSKHQLSRGIVRYEVNAPAWNDGATAERFIALPDNATMTYANRRGWDLPEGAVVGQTLSLVRDSGGSPVRLETRILTKQQNEWAGYSFRWNETQDDAELVAKGGAEINIGDSSWKIPSRSECMSCHSRAVKYVLGLSHGQMKRELSDGTDQLDLLAQLGLFSAEVNPDSETVSLVDPYDETQSLQDRARSYLHANCSSCHVEAGGGNARMELEARRPLAEMRIVSVRPQHATLGLTDPMLLAPGSPEDSVLYHRISRRGPGQMPPLMSTKVDHQAVHLIAAWIRTMDRAPTKFVRKWTTKDLQPHLQRGPAGRSLDQGRKLFHQLRCDQCHRFEEQGGGAGPNLSRILPSQTPLQVLESIIEPSAKLTEGFETSILITNDGRVLEGRITNETTEMITLQTDASFEEPLTIAKESVDERFQSQQSRMPSGLLNSLERDEILDLLAYLLDTADSQ